MPARDLLDDVAVAEQDRHGDALVDAACARRG